ncbi:MAG: hypothetical protein H7099_08295 [Gemmatimonadaceae bacterium]|nr:hypothetical protein [Gemmatimonadaceae bacterium]
MPIRVLSAFADVIPTPVPVPTPTRLALAVVACLIVVSVARSVLRARRPI